MARNFERRGINCENHEKSPVNFSYVATFVLLSLGGKVKGEGYHINTQHKGGDGTLPPNMLVTASVLVCLRANTNHE